MTPIQTLAHLQARLIARALCLDRIGHDILHEPIRKLLQNEAFECRRDVEVIGHALLREGDVCPVPARRARGLRMLLGGLAQ